MGMLPNRSTLDIHQTLYREACRGKATLKLVQFEMRVHVRFVIRRAAALHAEPLIVGRIPPDLFVLHGTAPRTTELLKYSTRLRPFALAA